MKHLEDKQLCPHCRKPLHRQTYLMARSAIANVLSWEFVAWAVVAVMIALVLVQVAPSQ